MSRLRFVPGNHTYYLDSYRVPSVTGILAQVGKPALVGWAARTVANYAADHWAELAAMDPTERRQLMGGAADRDRNRKAASGTQIHAWAEGLLHGEEIDVPGEYVATVEGLAKWWERAGWVAVRSECQVWSGEDTLTGGCAYAGTLDLIAMDGDQNVVLADIKTGKGVYPETALQLAAYADAVSMVTDGVDTANQRYDRLCVLHVRPDGVTLFELDRAERHIASQRFEILRMLKATREASFIESAVAK